MSAQPAPLELTLMEAMWLLRRLRVARNQMKDDMQALEERVHGGHDGDLAAAHSMIDGECMICDAIVRKLWVAMGLSGPPEPLPVPTPHKKK